jgi:hypothetical protein
MVEGWLVHTGVWNPRHARETLMVEGSVGRSMEYEELLLPKKNVRKRGLEAVRLDKLGDIATSYPRVEIYVEVSE